MSRDVLRWLGVVFVVVSILGGCARMEEHSRERAFQEDIGEYGRMIRWGFYDAALAFVRESSSEESSGGDGEGAADTPMEVDTEALKGIRVTSYEILSQRFSPRDPDRAVVRARIEYYREDSPVVRRLTDEQHWWYDEEAGRWYLDGSLPDFSR